LKDNAIIKRYGYALFDIYKEESKIDRIKDLFDNFIDTLNKNRELYNLFNSPVISKIEKLNLLKELMNIMNNVDKYFFNFLNLLVMNNRFKYIFSIYDFIIPLHNEVNNKAVATLYVTDKPESTILEQLKRELEELLHYTVIFDIKIKKEIIGGFIIIIKNMFIDASIKKTLNELVLNIKGEI
jgi:F-type H+-transporting ATPase subunit delta